MHYISDRLTQSTHRCQFAGEPESCGSFIRATKQKVQLHRLLFLSLLISKTKLKQTTASSDLVPGHFEEESDKWSTVVELSSAQKSPQQLHKTFWIRKQEKEYQNSASHLASCKELSALLPLCRQVLQPAFTWTAPTKQPPFHHELPPLPKMLHSALISYATLRKDWFPTAGDTEEKGLPLSRSHTLMHSIQTTWPILSTKNTANHISTLRLGFQVSQKSQRGASSTVLYEANVS